MGHSSATTILDTETVLSTTLDTLYKTVLVCKKCVTCIA